MVMALFLVLALLTAGALVLALAMALAGVMAGALVLALVMAMATKTALEKRDKTNKIKRKTNK
jgi:membrane protein implicated in regulation of membrane protease activity